MGQNTRRDSVEINWNNLGIQVIRRHELRNMLNKLKSYLHDDNVDSVTKTNYYRKFRVFYNELVNNNNIEHEELKHKLKNILRNYIQTTINDMGIMTFSILGAQNLRRDSNNNIVVDDGVVHGDRLEAVIRTGDLRYFISDDLSQIAGKKRKSKSKSKSKKARKNNKRKTKRNKKRLKGG